MKTITFDTRENWMQARLGKITGSRLASIQNCYDVSKTDIIKKLEELKIEFKKTETVDVLKEKLPFGVLEQLEKNSKKKIGFYELVAERLAVDDSEFEGYVPNETPADRGTRLQKYAIDRFTKETGKKVDESLVLWVSDENESIAISPDGTIIGESSAIETKCLSSARHIEAYITNQVPDEYEYQKIQYFVTNKELETLYFAFYDPRLLFIDFFYFTIKRKDIEKEISFYLNYQKKILQDVNDVVNKISNF